MDYYANQPRSVMMNKRQLDQALAEFRNRYLAADETDRLQAREYVNALANMLMKARDCYALFHHDLEIHSSFISQGLQLDEHGAPTNEPIGMPVRILSRAIAAWDLGKDYTPEDKDLIGE